jgi:hypothetical protein
MTSNSSPTDLNALFAAAQDDNNLSSGGLQALALNDLGAQIQAGLGVSIDDVQASEAILVLFVLDDSSSIRSAGNAQAVRDGMNIILQALADTKQNEMIYIYCIQLNRGVLFPFTPLVVKDPADPTGKKFKLDERLKLTAQNYNPSGSTPLFDTATIAFGTAIGKVQEFANAGVASRSITIILTDGENYGGRKVQPEDVRPVVDDLNAKEVHLVIGFGIEDGHTDFADVFGRMGIPNGRDKHGRPDTNAPNWVLTVKSDPSAIRAKCYMVSQSAVRASQAAAGAAFSQVAAGGFGST